MERLRHGTSLIGDILATARTAASKRGLSAMSKLVPARSVRAPAIGAMKGHVLAQGALIGLGHADPNAPQKN